MATHFPIDCLHASLAGARLLACPPRLVRGNEAQLFARFRHDEVAKAFSLEGRDLRERSGEERERTVRRGPSGQVETGQVEFRVVDNVGPVDGENRARRINELQSPPHLALEWRRGRFIGPYEPRVRSGVPLEHVPAAGQEASRSDAER